MQIKELFDKDITREIRPVIKVLDDRYIADEINEFVLTNEMLGNVSGANNGGMVPGLIEALANDSQFNKSVWISGFYGSGKSHLLKMLSYALAEKENSEVGVKELFAEVFNKSGDFELVANYKKLLNSKVETILFDIATVQSNNTDNNPVLTAFVKEFNRYTGYSYDPNIAAIERDIQKQGLLESFKKSYNEDTGLDWNTERDAISAFNTMLVGVYSKVSNASEEAALAYINDRRQEFKIDTEGFTKLVSDYLSAKGPNSTLIFCADEVSQFIDSSAKLVNFQMIAEGLSTINTGRALIFATAQTDISALVGQFKTEQKYDFTKLSARFEYKIPLTSSSVDQVVKQRLLKKKPKVYKALGELYDKEQHNLKTLFDFSDDMQKYPRFLDAENFIETYPAIPYQFDLLMSVMKGLSDHSAFSGSHESVGERSMLKRFHDAIKAIGGKELPLVIEFSQFFDSLRSYFQSKVITEIIQAEKQYIDNPLAVKLLKTLFLVKYVKSFKPTLDNISILMLSTLDPDFKIDSFKKKIQINLDELDQKTFIRKNGSYFEYLTDSEKDVDNEIKNTLVESTEKMDVLKELIYSDLLPDTTLKLQNGKSIYSFGKKINDNPISNSQSKEFNINIYISVDDDSVVEQHAATDNMGTDDLLIFLTPSNSLSSEVTRYCKTKRYLKLTQRDNTNQEKASIIQAHETQNHKRRAELLEVLRQRILDSPVYINGTQQQLNSTSDARNKILWGLQHLAETTFTRMNELLPASQEDIKRTFSQSDNVLMEADLTLPENEILTKINLAKSLSNRLTMDDLIKHFKAKPYGWNDYAVANCVAALLKKGKVKLTQDSTELKQEEFFNALTNTRVRPQVLIAPEQEFSQQQVSGLKDFAREYFSEPIEESEPKKVVTEFRTIIQTNLGALKDLYSECEYFPFLENLSKTIGTLESIKDKDSEYYFNELAPTLEQLNQDKDDVDQIKAFFAGPQKEKYSQAKSYVDNNESNFSYLEDQNSVDELDALLKNPKPYTGGTIPAIFNAYNVLKQQVDIMIEDERENTSSEIELKITELLSNKQFSELVEEQRTDVLSKLVGLKSSVDIANDLSLIQMRRLAIGDAYTESLNRIADIYTSDSMPSKKYISVSSLRFSYHKATLDSEQEVNDYIDKMREKYLDALRDSKGIAL